MQKIFDAEFRFCPYCTKPLAEAGQSDEPAELFTFYELDEGEMGKFDEHESVETPLFMCGDGCQILEPEPVYVSDERFEIRQTDSECVLLKYNGNDKNVVIPDIVTRIGKYAFPDCKSLTSIKIPGSVKTIEKWAIKGCKSLTSVTMQDGVSRIGENAFFICPSLKRIYIPASVTEIGKHAFGYSYYDSNIWTLDFTVVCHRNTVAERYAKENGFKIAYVNEQRKPVPVSDEDFEIRQTDSVCVYW